MTSGTMTNRVDRLLTRGFVERRPDTTDRRGVIVRLTSAGMAVVDAALSDLLVREHALLAELGPAERTDLAGSCDDSLRPFESDA